MSFPLIISDTGRLTADAIYHEWVQLLLAEFALPREIGHGLDLTVKQIVQQRQRHLLCRAAVGGDMKHVGRGHRTAHTHLRVILIPQPGACWVILCREENGQVKMFKVNLIVTC